MKKSEWAKILPIIQALVNGKTIQFSCDNGMSWNDISVVDDDGSERDIYIYAHSNGNRWRVKPD